MANLQQRAGRVQVRVGGNTQETAVLVPSLADGKMLEKDLQGTSNPTLTPPVVFTPEVFHLMRGISSLVNVRWYMGKFHPTDLLFYPLMNLAGIPFNDTTNFRLGIAEQGQAILGEYLIGLQAGNEPDLYARHQRRPPVREFYLIPYRQRSTPFHRPTLHLIILENSKTCSMP
jgi:hypothetical protein